MRRRATLNLLLVTLWVIKRATSAAAAASNAPLGLPTLPAAHLGAALDAGFDIWADPAAPEQLNRDYAAALRVQSVRQLADEAVAAVESVLGWGHTGLPAAATDWPINAAAGGADLAALVGCLSDFHFSLPSPAYLSPWELAAGSWRGCMLGVPRLTSATGQEQ